MKISKTKLTRIEKHARKFLKQYDFTPEEYELAFEGFISPFRKMLVDKKRSK
jgi:hypothetical protein